MASLLEVLYVLQNAMAVIGFMFVAWMAVEYVRRLFNTLRKR